MQLFETLLATLAAPGCAAYPTWGIVCLLLAIVQHVEGVLNLAWWRAGLLAALGITLLVNPFCVEALCPA